jgi:hypothetical protein
LELAHDPEPVPFRNEEEVSEPLEMPMEEVLSTPKILKKAKKKKVMKADVAVPEP